MNSQTHLPRHFIAVGTLALIFSGLPLLPGQDADQNQKAGLTYRKFPSHFGGSNAPLTPNPVVMLQFNAPVNAEGARLFFRFYNKERKRYLTAKIKKPSLREFVSFHVKMSDEEKKALDLNQFLLVKPASSLAEDATWYLIVGKGLSSSDRTHEFARGKADYLGMLRSFAVNSIAAKVDYDSPRTIEINTNKARLHPKFRGEALADYVSVKPEPEGFSIKSRYNGLTLSGEFDYDRQYEVIVRDGLVADDTTQLARQVRKSVIFHPDKGYLTLPDFSTSQSASGLRKFDLHTGNLSGVHTQLKKLDGDSLIFALRGYSKEYEGWGGKQKTPFNLVPGRKIYDSFRKRRAGFDKSETVHYDWDTLTGGQKFGAYFFCAEGESDAVADYAVGGQSIVQLTDMGLAWKRSGTDTVVYTFSLEKGTPLAGVKLNLLDGEGVLIVEAESDADGVARFSVKDYGSLEGGWLDARFQDDRHVISFGKYIDTMSLWNFSIPYRYDKPIEGERRTLLFTDRPVYKPGEEVFVKVISRLVTPDQLLPAGGGNARLRIMDPRNRKILERDIALSSRGSFDGSFTLPDAGLGWYEMQIDFNPPPTEADRQAGNGRDKDWRLITRRSFQVEEYRVNTFEVALKAPPQFQAGDQIQIPVSAKYYMGKPLSKSVLNWSAHSTSGYPELRGFEDFRFGDGSRADEGSTFSTNDSIHLSGDGQADISLQLPEQTEIPFPRRVSLRAEVIDANQQTVATSVSFTVHSSDYYIGLRPPEGVYRAGDTVPISIATVAADGSVFTKPVAATIRAEKEIWNTVKVRGAQGKITTRNERTLELVFEKKVNLRTSVDPSSGLAHAMTQEIPFSEAGTFVITVEARDDSGRKVLSNSKFNVIGATEPNWSWYDVVRVDVIPDKETYHIGDTAKLLVRSPVFGHALITTERGGVRTTQSRPIDQYETIIEVPVEKGDAPNIFASVLIVRGSQDSTHKYTSTDYRMGYCQLKVVDPAAELAVTIDAGDAEYYQPGESVKVEALIADNKGQPVPNAEVTLFAVDEGVLSLTGHKTPDPGKVFYKPFPLSVSTGQSLSDLLSENPAEQDFGNKGYVIGGGGMTGGLDPDKIRKDFKPLAFWKGALHSGDDGRIVTTFIAPDNLTTFRIMAVVAEGDRFGHAEKPVVINKPLIIEPALPGFSNLTDQVDLTAVLHNNTDASQDLEVTVTLDDHGVFLDQISNGPIPTALTEGKGDKRRVERVSLGAGATGTLRFPVGMTQVGEAKWNWKVASLTDSKLRDSTESTLPVGYPLPLLRQSKSFPIESEEDLKNVLEKFNPRLLNGHGNIGVTLSNSRVIEALDALDYLLKYPYGCVEQTTSTTLPWLSTLRMRQALPGLNKTEAEVTAIVESGARHLFSMQTRDGGLAYWPGGTKSVLWGSAYGGMALALAQKRGIELPQDQVDALWKYLSKNLRDVAKLNKPYDLSQRCLALYTLALAGKPEPAYHEILFNKRDQLPAEARALLALAMTEGALKEENRVVLEECVKTLLDDPGAAPESEVSWYQRPYLAATQLLARLRFNPEDGRIEKQMDDLMKMRKPDRGWGSTYSNAWPLMAVSAYSELKESALKPNQASVKFADNTRSVSFSPEPSSQSLTFDFEGDVRQQPLSVNVKNSGKLYATVNLATRPETIPLKPENKGLGIMRSYQKVAVDGGVGPADDLMVGDLILVTLKVNIPDDRQSYLAIDDPLPAIFEAVNPDFQSQQTQHVDQAKSGKRLPRLYANYRELKKERALFFADYCYRAGDYQIQYLARVVAPGNVIAPPAKIEAMYEPERFGLSGTQQISARPLDLGGHRVAAQ